MEIFAVWRACIVSIFDVGGMRMRPFFITLAMAASVVATSAYSADDDSSVAFIKVSDGSAAVTKSLGSGALINDQGWIITAKHVFEAPGVDLSTDKIQVAFKTKSSSLFPAMFFGCDPFNADLCLIHVEPGNIKDVRPVPGINCVQLSVGSSVVALGFSAGAETPNIVNGQVTNNSLTQHFKRFMSTGIQAGMSGGPILDSSGALVGISYGAADSHTETLYSPIEFGRVLLQATGSDCRPR
jgi:S1-C subfamily serine protease